MCDHRGKKTPNLLHDVTIYNITLFFFAILFWRCSIGGPLHGGGGPATHSVASVVATLEVEGSELLRPLPLVRRWRTKQNLDYCFLMMYAQSKGIYYVQLEDDIIAKQ